MSIFSHQEAFVAPEIIELVAHERQVALSTREWKHRLAGYGYGIRDTADGGHVLQKLSTHTDLCVLPAEMFH
ncbi:hypothetical protein [Sulfitobacter sp. S190]|uniref:hypothetical protein n=1 Tax=Sulfitobacter sp. S190 TaxID=2867022 RepID=UPI0021A7E384|nr:hypothetical protein [Sulfitobacter sp. S190]UWR22407.1 hypothetical protein K3756_17380 [Sulfitobacter sp. S190]